MNHLKLAAAILKTVDIREGSYDKIAAEQATKERDEKYRNNNFSAGTDYSKFYTKTLEQSAEEATKELGLPEDLNYIIWLLLFSAWNDAIAWAETTKAAANE